MSEKALQLARETGRLAGIAHRCGILNATVNGRRVEEMLRGSLGSSRISEVAFLPTISPGRRREIKAQKTSDADVNNLKAVQLLYRRVRKSGLNHAFDSHEEIVGKSGDVVNAAYLPKLTVSPEEVGGGAQFRAFLGGFRETAAQKKRFGDKMLVRWKALFQKPYYLHRA